jgi:hypothetical protein
MRRLMPAKKIMLFWKENKDDTEYMHCGRSRYMKVINEDEASVTRKVAVKQLHYIPITPRLKILSLCKEMVQQMRWHKEGIRDSEDANIMSHPADVEAWHTLDHFDPEFAWDPGVSVLVYRWMISNLTAQLVLHTLASQFS